MGIYGLIMAILSAFGLVGFFQHFLGIQILKFFPQWVWLVLFILGLVFLPYKSFRDNLRTIEELKQQHLSSNSINNKLFVIECYNTEFGALGSHGYPDNLNEKRILKIDIGITSFPSRFVESLHLELKGELLDTQWTPGEVGDVSVGGFFYFGIPNSIQSGRHTVKVVAFVVGIRQESEPFEVTIPE
ncbi:hypothetical protein ACFLYV_00270 [Chloroflexota bacterium]